MRVAVVGAGLSGLITARTLAADGHDVVVLDKGRSPGGRLATRRIAGATLDHGAQFFTVRDDRFAALVRTWSDDGVAVEWCRGFGPEPDGHPRYTIRGGMNALAKHLATGLDVRCGSLVFAVRPAPETAGGWVVGLDDGTAVVVDGLVVTCPLPQSLAVLMTAGVTLPDPLRSVDYDRTLALLAVLDGPSGVPPPGGAQAPVEHVQFVADNQAKGISAIPAVTLHATPAWSEEHWDEDRAAALDALVDLARPWFGASAVVEVQVKRWRFATPRVIWPEPCHRLEDAAVPLVLGGDAFAGPRVEGAALSGLAAAQAVLA